MHMPMASNAAKLVLFVAVLLFLSSARALQAAAAISNGGRSADETASPLKLNSPNDIALRGRSLLASAQIDVFSLDSYGAHGDGKHDDTKALARTWKAACSSERPAVQLLVPKGKTYLLKSIILSGPCKSNIIFTVKGALVASTNVSGWGETNRGHWVLLRRVTGLTVNGGGTIDGNGETWWQNSCKVNKALPCKGAPTALTFHFCTNLTVEDLKIVNSQQFHLSVEYCRHVQLAHLTITSPSTSPNTDGIHVTHSKDVQVSDCMIKTGDDCISIESGTHNLHVTKVVCWLGHGISVGGLGKHNSKATVSGINIDTVQLYNTTNGARIKTWQGGSGHAKNIIFQNMIMDNVRNPIIIDQKYCDSVMPCKTQRSAVEVSNVIFKNIRGTTTSKDDIKLNCSKNVPCYNILLHNIDLKLKSGHGDTKSTCLNAKWMKLGTVIPQPCTAQNYANNTSWVAGVTARLVPLFPFP